MKPNSRGSSSANKTLEIEAQGGDDIHYHFHGRAEPLGGQAGRGNGSSSREHGAVAYDRAQSLGPMSKYPNAGMSAGHASSAASSGTEAWWLYLLLGGVGVPLLSSLAGIPTCSAVVKAVAVVIMAYGIYLAHGHFKNKG